MNSRLDIASHSRLYWWGEQGEPGLHYGRYHQSDRDWFFVKSGETRLGFGFASSWHRNGGGAILLVPHWLAALALATLLWWLVLRPALIRRKRVRRGKCVRCGYDVRGQSERCPECGQATTEKTLAGV